MAQLLVSDLDEEVYERLKQKAERNHRSLEAEVKSILETAARPIVTDLDGVRARANDIRANLEGRIHSDSSEMIREDRSA